MLLALHIDNRALVLAGRALPGRMSSQQGEDEGRAGHDAEFAERHAEVSPCHRRVFSLPLARTRTKTCPLCTFLPLKKPSTEGFFCSCAANVRQSTDFAVWVTPPDASRQDECH